jgi:hypothetical protein
VANVKITDLSAIADPASTDVLPVVDVTADTTNKISIAEILRTAPDGTAAAPAISFEGDSNTGIYHPGSEQIGFATSGIGRVFIASDGNVGINNSNPGYALTVGSASPTFGRVAQFDSSTADSLIAFGTSGGTGQNAAEIGADTADLVVNTQNIERMRIASNGRVGIGTSDPAYRLTVSEGNVTSVSAKATGDNTSARVVRYIWSFDDGDGASIHGVRSTGLSASDVYLSFRTGGITNSEERMRIISNGNVGIGTSSPDAPLSVKAPNSAGSSQVFRVQKSNTDSCVFRIDLDPDANTVKYVATGSQGASHVFGPANTTEYMRIDSNGRVGIGTSDPETALHISGTGVSDSRLTVERSGVEGVVGIIGNNLLLSGKGSDGSNGGIDFFTGGSEKMQIASSGNVGIGASTPGAKLEVSGGDALIYGLNVGRGAGAIDSNTAVGDGALNANTTGDSNTAIGRNALFNNTTGIDDTAIGRAALFNNTEGNYNTALGRSALQSNTTGTNNTAIGRNALLNNEGSCNTANGVSALFNNTTGSGNIGVGFLNSAGTYAPVFNPTTENNRLVLGHTSITNAYVQVAWTVVSDERDKMNFAPVPYGLDFVNQLQPTAYQFKVDRDTEEPHGDVRYGFKAQDILALEGDNPVIIDTEDPERLKYKGEHLVPVLVNAVQELTTMVKDLQAEIAALKSA